MDKLKLVWAEKFRKLIERNNTNNKEIIFDFLRYCDEEEEKFNKSINQTSRDLNEDLEIERDKQNIEVSD